MFLQACGLMIADNGNGVHWAGNFHKKWADIRKMESFCLKEWLDFVWKILIMKLIIVLDEFRLNKYDNKTKPPITSICLSC